MSNHGSYYQVSTTSNDDLEWISHYNQQANRLKITYYNYGILNLLLSSLCLSFGNSLEPISMLSWLHIIFLLVGIDYVLQSFSISDNSNDNYNHNNHIILSYRLIKVLIFICLTQTVAFLIGFYSIFSYPYQSILSFLISIFVGFLYSFLVILFVLIPYIYFIIKYQNSVLRHFIFPTLYSTITYTFIGSMFSIFTLISNSILDYEPLRQISSLFGIFGVNFIFLLTGSILANCIINSKFLIKKNGYISCLIIICLFIISSFNYQSDSFYQKDISIELKETYSIPVSCIYGQLIMKGSDDWKTIWYTLLNRVRNGDKIIMMAEESLRIETDDDEKLIIHLAQVIANQASISNSNNNNDDNNDIDYQPVYIGISYIKKTIGHSMGTNHFTLISSSSSSMMYNASSLSSQESIDELLARATTLNTHDDQNNDDVYSNHHNSHFHYLQNIYDNNKIFNYHETINKNNINNNFRTNFNSNNYQTNKNNTANNNSNDIDNVIWNYRKSHPVPFIESHIIPGPPILPTYSSPYGILGGAICFDLDYPNFMIQSGRKYVDILLQPSWTWGAINYRHFDDNAIRAIENGFTLFRCSSDGESGIVNHKGKVLARKYSGHKPDIASVVSFSLPIKSQTENNNKNEKNNYRKLHTFYLMIGYMVEWLCLVCSILFYILSIISKENFQLILNKYFKISIKTYINNLLAINDDSNETNDTTSNNNNNTITTNYENINISDSNSKIVRMNGNVEMVQTP